MRAQVHGDDGQALALEPAQHLTDEPAAYGVGLDQDESALGHGAPCRRAAVRSVPGTGSVPVPDQTLCWPSRLSAALGSMSAAARAA